MTDDIVRIPGGGDPLKNLPTGAFGDVVTAEETPIFQVTAQYGLRDDVLSAALGGTTTAENSNFKISTGTGANNVAAIVSNREAQYKAGQGLTAKFTALFTDGVANSTQQAGFITSESAFGFGFNGTEFGIVYAKDGQLENQELTITTGATAGENASITVDGIAYSVPITNSSINQNAFEIATYLDANDPRYRFRANQDKVYGLAQLPDFGSGAWSFSSGTAVASWTEIQTGTIPTETWIPKSDWNVNPNIELDPTKGNVYKVQMQYLGYGGIIFSVENAKTAKLEKVHIIPYASTAIVPSVSNPIFRIGWAARNTGNTSDIIVQGASAGAFVEGMIRADGRPHAACNTQASIDSGIRQNIIALRNRLTFNSTANRAEILPILLTISSEATKPVIFEIVQNPVVEATGYLDWQFADESNQLMEFATNNVRITDGIIVGCFVVSPGVDKDVDVEKLIKYHLPSEEFAITGRIISGGSTADLTVSGNWEQDL